MLFKWLRVWVLFGSFLAFKIFQTMISGKCGFGKDLKFLLTKSVRTLYKKRLFKCILQVKTRLVMDLDINKFTCLFSVLGITLAHPLKFEDYSFIAFKPIRINERTEITIRFKPTTSNGILFYVAWNLQSHSGDFLSITLHDG